MRTVPNLPTHKPIGDQVTTSSAAPEHDQYDADLLLARGGQWQVTTSTATYLLDLDRMQALRTDSDDVSNGHSRQRTVAMLPMELEHLLVCQKGLAMVLYVATPDAQALAIRRTTAVVDIQPVSP